MSIVSADRNQKLDGSVLRIAQHIDTGGIPIMPMTRIEDFVFNESLYTLDKYILLDYSELYWNSENTDTHLFGKNTSDFPEIFKGDEWKKFDDFVRGNPPLIYFKRELFRKDVGGNVFPIDYPCWTNPYPIQTKEEFDARPINVFNYWGRSSEYRVRLHADIWRNSSRNGAAICDNLYHLNAFLQEERSPNKWVTVNTPHYSRIPIESILQINGMSKLSISMRGAGMKCFRHAESPTNSVMVMDNDDLAWGYSWIDSKNCLKIDGDPIEEIELFTKADNLYEIYVNGMETIDKYRIENYVNNYIQPIIQSL